MGIGNSHVQWTELLLTVDVKSIVVWVQVPFVKFFVANIFYSSLASFSCK